MMFEEGGLRWIDSGGGPLILLDRRWLGDWRGHPHRSSGDETATDYDRACGVEDYLGLLPVGAGQGLILGDEPLSTAWCPLPAARGGLLVRWRYALDGTSVAAMLSHQLAIAWVTAPLLLPIPSGEAIIFDSAYSGTAFEESLSIPVIPGDYRVETSEYAPNEETAFLLHRLTLR